MPYLISYDIENDRLRDKIAKRLLASGCARLQKSVFAGPVDAVTFAALRRWLQQHVKAAGDSVFILDVGPETLRRAEWIGAPAPDWNLAADPPDVLFI